MNQPAAGAPSQRATGERLLAEAAALTRRLAAAAHVSVHTLAVQPRTKRWARAERRQNGFWVVINPGLLTAPEPVLRGVLAHEIGHIVLGHPQGRRRLLVVAGTAGMALLLAGYVAGLWLIFTFGAWLLPIVIAGWLVSIVAIRATLLLVMRRREYQVDRVAAGLLGSTEPVVAFLDWFDAHTPSKQAPLPLRLWKATYPSNAARRQALLEWVASGGIDQSSQRR